LSPFWAPRLSGNPAFHEPSVPDGRTAHSRRTRKLWEPTILVVPEHKLQALLKLSDRFESREIESSTERSVVSDELKEEIEENLAPELEQNRNVYLVRQGRGLKIASDIRKVNVARDGIEPPTRGFSVLCSTD
jgi:hypothetical protein